MTPPTEDLYAFLGLPQTAVPEAIREAIARTEKRLSGKHGLTLTELSKRRALLLQAKRWLVPADRKEEYDRARASGAKPVVAKKADASPSPQPRAGAKPVPVAAIPSSSAIETTSDAEEIEEEGASSWLPLPVLIAAVLGVILAFFITFAIFWALSDSQPRVAATTDGDAETAAVEPEAQVPAADTEAAASAVIRANGSDEVVLTPTNAKLIGPTIRLDGAENPPRIENWTSSDFAEWEFESPAAAIYQATLEYAMKPESEGNRFKISVGSAAVSRTVGAGAYADSAYRDVFFLKIEKRGLTKLKIEPLDVVGGELMQFRSLTLASRQKTAAP